MQVCPAGHFSNDPDVCDVCDLPLHHGPRTPAAGDDGLDVATAAARTRAVPGGTPPPAATTVMPTGAGAEGDAARVTSVLPSGPGDPGDATRVATRATPAHRAESQAATTAMPTYPAEREAADPSQAATTAIPAEAVRAATVLPDEPPGRATTVMPGGSPAATTVMPVTEPSAVPGAQAATEVFTAPPSPLRPEQPATPGPRPTAAAGSTKAPLVPPTGATAVLGQGRNAHWHAVLTVDAAWYAVQDTPFQMPPEGRTTVVQLGSAGATLGRRSRSRGTVPDIDCSTDPGVSRRHARFELEHGRWYVEDLGSANGTYVAHAGAPLPEQPISVGRRVEVGPGDTVYVGAWTRISIEDDDAWGTS